MEGSVPSCVERNRQGEIILESLQDMRNKKEMLDATLACDDATLNVHKLVLSACSSFLRELISNNQDSHTSICLPGVKSGLLAPLLDFMYAGEVFLAPGDLTEFLELAQELQVKGLTQIAPVDTVITAQSTTVYVDIKKLYQEGEVVHKNKDVEPIDAQKDANQNGVERLSHDNAKQNIYVMEAAILVNTIDKDVMNIKDKNYSGANIRIDVDELVMDGKQEEDNQDLLPKRLVFQNIKLKGTENQLENDSKASQHQVEQDKEATNQIYIEKENIKEQLNYTSEIGSEEAKVSSEQHLLIRSKIAKVGVKEDRRHLCKVCDQSGTKDVIYNHIAMEHVNPIATRQEEKIGKEKIEEKIKPDKIIMEKAKTAEKTSTTPKKTASELAVEWGDDGDSSIVCKKVVTETQLANPINTEHAIHKAMENINPFGVELADHNAMERINPIATEPANPIATELAHNKAVEHIHPFATELARHNAMEGSTPIAMEPANPISMELANHNAMEDFNPIVMEPAKPIATELVLHNAMEDFNPIAMEPAKPIATELTHHNALERINPIAMEPAKPIDTENVNGIVTQYVNPNAMDLVTQHINPKTDDEEDFSSDKIIVHVVEEKPEQLVPKIAASQAPEIRENYTEVRKYEENKNDNFHKESIVPSKKRKTVTFSSDEPEEFIYEREEYEDTRHVKKKRIAPSDAEIVVNVNDMLKLHAGGILSVTKEGFQFQDEPQQIEDLDNIRQKAVCKKIVMLGRNRFKCMECGKKGQKGKMLNHIK